MKISRLQLVDGILALLSDESKWCKRAPARDIQGNSVESMSFQAASFCVYGAARRVSDTPWGQLDPGDFAFWDTLAEIGNRTGPIGHFNDTHTYVEIIERLRAVRETYADAEASEQLRAAA